jgi:hypothetical protein
MIVRAAVLAALAIVLTILGLTGAAGLMLGLAKAVASIAVVIAALLTIASIIIVTRPR